jgi:hypothetical protein
LASRSIQTASALFASSNINSGEASLASGTKPSTAASASVLLVTNAGETLSIPRPLVGAIPQHLQTVPRREMSDMVKVLEDWENRQ